MKTLFDYLARNHSLEDFLLDFHGVTREQALRSLTSTLEVRLSMSDVRCSHFSELNALAVLNVSIDWHMAMIASHPL